jgi:hypothetical protein
MKGFFLLELSGVGQWPQFSHLQNHVLKNPEVACLNLLDLV